jgi:hypothetical protein
MIQVSEKLESQLATESPHLTGPYATQVIFHCHIRWLTPSSEFMEWASFSVLAFYACRCYKIVGPFVLFMEIGKAILVGLMNHRVLAGLTTFCWPTCFLLTPLSHFLIRSPLVLLYKPNHLVHLPFMLFQWHQSFIEVILLLVNDLFWLA